MSRTLALLGAGALLAGDIRAQDSLAAKEPGATPSPGGFDTSLTLNTGMRSQYLASGFDLGAGPFIEGSAKIAVGKTLEFSVWGIRDLGTGQGTFNEVDFDLSATIPIRTEGTLTLEGRVSYGHWLLSPGTEQAHADILALGVHAQLNSTHTQFDVGVAEVLPTFDRTAGTKLSFGVWQNLMDLPLSPRTTLSVGAGAKMDYLLGYFQEDSALSHVTPSVGVSLERENFGLRATVGQQYGFNGKASTSVFTISLNRRF